MLFNFILTPLERIQPWGKPGELRLHWFGLTDGQYWINAGDDTLLEYSQDVCSRGVSPYCDYQVVRLYEDLIEIAPHILDPVPISLIPYITGESASQWSELSDAWFAQRDEHLEDDRYWEVADLSAVWIGNRTLDTSYLSPSANIHMWSDNSFVHVEWDNRAKFIENIPAWSAKRGEFLLTRRDFKAELQSFHARLMDQMSERVERVLHGALPPEIYIDFQGLQREQIRRCDSLERTFREASLADWDAITGAIHEIEESVSNS